MDEDVLLDKDKVPPAVPALPEQSFVAPTMESDPNAPPLPAPEPTPQEMIRQYLEPRRLQMLQQQSTTPVSPWFTIPAALLSNIKPLAPVLGAVGSALEHPSEVAKSELANRFKMAEELRKRDQEERDLALKEQEQGIKNKKFQQEQDIYAKESLPQGRISLLGQHLAAKLSPEDADIIANMPKTELDKVSPLMKSVHEELSKRQEAQARLSETQIQHRLLNAQREGAQGNKQQAEVMKEYNKMIDNMDPTGRGGVVNRDLIQRIQGGERMQALAGIDNKSDLTNQQMVELARSLDSMISKGQTTEAVTRGLIPPNAAASGYGILQWIKSEPVGAHQQEFVKNMLSTAQREKTLAIEQLKERQARTAANAFRVKSEMPEEHSLALKRFGINPETDLDEQGLYKRKDSDLMGGTVPTAETRIVGGKKYQKVSGGWQEVK